MSPTVITLFPFVIDFKSDRLIVNVLTSTCLSLLCCPRTVSPRARGRAIRGCAIPTLIHSLESKHERVNRVEPRCVIR